MIKMKSKTDFANPRIVKKDGGHTVAPGDPFETDWLHAKDLVAGGLAEADNPEDLEREPADALVADSRLSVPDLGAINKRRNAGAGDKAKKLLAARKAAEEARADLAKAEAAAKDKPGTDADKKVAAAADKVAQADAAIEAIERA